MSHAMKCDLCGKYADCSMPLPNVRIDIRPDGGAVNSHIRVNLLLEHPQHRDFCLACLEEHLFPAIAKAFREKTSHGQNTIYQGKIHETE